MKEAEVLLEQGTAAGLAGSAAESEERYVVLTSNDETSSGGLHCVDFSVRLDILGLVDDVIALVPAAMASSGS